jgi:hypothetical protein
MKIYACEYKTQGIPIIFPVIENITWQRYFPKEFHMMNHFL